MDKTEQFINKAISVHGDKYGYSKAVYGGNETNLIINCPIHGDFQQPPKRHLIGAGCPSCGRLRTNAGKLLTKDMFITRAVNKHGNKYGYEKVNFVKVSDKVTIHCNTCNKDFDQSVHNHLAGSGCPDCGIKVFTNSRKIPGEDFIKRSISIHGDKYGYEKVNYINASTKVPILCK